MADTAQIKRQLKIKTGVVTRLLKENTMYRDEVTQQKIKVDKLVAEGAEEWDIKNGNNMLNESNRMVEDSASRLGKAVAELRELIVSVETDETIADTGEYQAAKGILEEANT